MPAELKRIASQVANAGRKPFEPGRARRYQQLLLYGGGFAVTLFILMCALLVTRLDVQDYRAQARLTFLYRKAQFSRTLEMADMVLATYGGRIEQLWNQGARPSADALAQFSAAGGVLGASNGDGSETLLALARLTPDRPAPSYARYLGALFGLVRQDDRSGHVLPPALVSGGEPLGGYLIGLDAPFLAVLGTELVPRAHTLEPGTDLRTLIDGLMPTGIARQKTLMQSRPFVFDRRLDPLSGRVVMRFARRLDDAAGRPFGWLVINGLHRVDDVMAPRSDDEDVAIVDARHDIVFGRERDRSMIERALHDARAARRSRRGAARRRALRRLRSPAGHRPRDDDELLVAQHGAGDACRLGHHVRRGAARDRAAVVGDRAVRSSRAAPRASACDPPDRERGVQPHAGPSCARGFVAAVGGGRRDDGAQRRGARVRRRRGRPAARQAHLAGVP
nr:hypothetical protein [Burkholderia vietnamiensis]